MMIRPPVNQPNRRLIRIRVLRNGNPTFKGVYMRVVMKKYDSLSKLLPEVTEALKAGTFIPRPGIRVLFSMEGIRIEHVEELQNGETYVAACQNETFKSHVQYPQEIRPASAVSVSRSPTLSPRTPMTPTFIPRLVTIVRHGNRPRHMFRVLLNRRTASSLEHVMSTISTTIRLDGGPLHALFAQSGRAVTRVDELFGKDHVFFGFANKLKYFADDLVLDQVEIDAINKLNKMPNSEKLKGHSSSSHTIYYPVDTSLQVPHNAPAPVRETPPQIRMKYDIGETLGTGTNSVVKLCSVRHSKDGTNYALKITTKTEENYQLLNNEVTMLKSLRHVNIVRLLAMFDEPAETYLVLELLTDGNLHTALKTARIGDYEAKRFIANLASALCHVHSMLIVHRDVRPATMMITRDARGERSVKLCDFGLAIQSSKPLYELCGSTFFMSPEMLRGTGYGAKLDVWASGVVLYYMMTQVPPFLGGDEDEDRRLIMAGDINVAAPEWRCLPPGARDLIEHMLCVDVEERYSTEDVLHHPWVTGDEFALGDGDRTRSTEDASLDLEVSEHGVGDHNDVKPGRRVVRVLETLQSELREDGDDEVTGKQAALEAGIEAEEEVDDSWEDAADVYHSVKN